MSASVLRDVASGLVEIHGQHDDRGLLNPKGHRALLDAFREAGPGARRQGLGAGGAADSDEPCRGSGGGGSGGARPRMARTCDWRDRARWRPKPGEETSLAEQRAAMQAGEKAAESLTGLDELARRVGRRSGAASNT